MASVIMAVWFMFQASEDLLKQHYADLAARPFFPGLVKYMSSGPVVPMVSTNSIIIVNKISMESIYESLQKKYKREANENKFYYII